MRECTDEILVASCLEGDRRAWKEFWNRFLKQVYTFAVDVFELEQRDVRGFLDHAVERIHSGVILPGFPGSQPFAPWFRITLRDLLAEYLDGNYGTASPPRPRQGTKRPVATAIDEPKTAQFAKLLQIKHAFEALKPEDRVLLKLSFVWYFRFAPDEIEYLARLNRCPVREVLRRLSELRRETAAQHSRAIEQEHVRIDPLQDLIAGELHLASLYRRQRNLEASHNIDLSLIGVIGDIQQELTGAEARLLKQFDPQGHEAILVRVTPVRIVPLLNERWTAAALQNRLDALARTLTTGPKGAT